MAACPNKWLTSARSASRPKDVELEALKKAEAFAGDFLSLTTEDHGYHMGHPTIGCLVVVFTQRLNMTWSAESLHEILRATIPGQSCGSASICVCRTGCQPCFGNGPRRSATSGCASLPQDGRVSIPRNLGTSTILADHRVCCYLTS